MAFLNLLKNSLSSSKSGDAEPSTAAASSRPPPVPRSSTSSSSSRLSTSSSNMCAICLSSVDSGAAGQGQAIFIAECFHSFHFNCITQNVKHGNLVCPICRCKWKQLPFQFQAPTQDTTNPQQNRVLRRAQVLPSNPEPESFSDDEPLPTVSAASAPLSQSRPLTLKCFPEYPAVLASDSPQNFSMLVRVSAPPLDAANHHHRAPIDLVTVLDVSGSMAFQLPLLKRAVTFIIENLDPSDRLSIVTFSSQARRVLPLKRMSDEGREYAKHAVNSLSCAGGTSIVAGLKKGVRVLEERRHKGSIASIILLSDGCDTHSHAGIPSHGLQNRLDYLKTLPPSIFPNNNVALLEQSQMTFPVYAFGFGPEHDSAAMHAISDSSGGTFSFIESIDILQDAFARCIGGLLSIVAQSVQLFIESGSPGVHIRSIPSGKYQSKVSPLGRDAVIAVGNLYAEEEKEFLVYLSLPTSLRNTKEFFSMMTHVASISCLYKDSVSLASVRLHGERLQIRRPIILFHADRVPSLEVDRQKARIAVAEAIAEAKEMAERGLLERANALLTERESQLLSTPSAQAGDELCSMLAAELKETKVRMESNEVYNQSGRAYVLSGMSSHSLQRATTRGHTTSLLEAGAVRGETGSGNLRATTSFETPSMVEMVSKSQVFSEPRRPFKKYGSKSRED